MNVPKGAPMHGRLRHPFGEISRMSKISDRRRGIVRGSFRSFGLAATAILLLATAPGQRAQALSLISPGAAPTAKHASDGLATEVRGRHGGGHGGGGFRRGGFRGGGAAFHGGGFCGGGYRAGPAFHRGGGYRYAGPGIVRHHHFAPRRAYWHHRRHFRPRYYGYAPYYYPQRHYYPRRYCRVVWTYYGPRKICRYRPWHHHWRHHHRRHHRFQIYW